MPAILLLFAVLLIIISNPTPRVCVLYEKKKKSYIRLERKRVDREYIRPSYQGVLKCTHVACCVILGLLSFTIYCDVVEEFWIFFFLLFSLFIFLIVKTINKLRHPRVHEKMKWCFIVSRRIGARYFRMYNASPGKEITHKNWSYKIQKNPQHINLACCCRWRRIMIIIIITSNFVLRWRSEKKFELKAYYRLFSVTIDYREDVHQISEIPIVICFRNELPAAVSKLRDLLPLLFYCISVPVSFSFFLTWVFWSLNFLPVLQPEMSAGRRETQRTRNCTMGHFWGWESRTEPLKARDDRRYRLRRGWRAEPKK